MSSGALSAQELADAQACVARGELDELEHQTAQHALDQALRTEEVATRLGIDTDEVERRLREQTLFAFTSNDQRHYPKWQFTADADQPVLSGLAEVVDAIPAGMLGATILGFMTMTQDETRINGVSVTPRTWLLSGGDPQVVRSLSESYLQC